MLSESEINFRQSDIQYIDGKAFIKFENETYFYTCNAGTADYKGLRFAKLWADQTSGITYAFQNARSNYIFINVTATPINRAFNFPGNKMDIGVSDYINKLLEVQTNIVKESTKKNLYFISQIDKNLEEKLEMLSEEELVLCKL